MKKVLLFSLLLIFVFSLCLFSLNITLSASSIDAVMRANYIVGDTLTIPEYSFNDNGTIVKAKSYVEYPDGSVYRENEVSFLDAGTYTIKYVANNNSKELVKTYEIVVNETLYHFENSNQVKSYAYYGVDDSKYNTGIEGLTVKLYSQDVFYFDQVLDLRNCQENIHCAFMKFFALPDTMGHFDVERFAIRLTDIYDENIHLDINIFPYPVRVEPSELPDNANENWKYFDTFISVNGENQISTGLGWEADGSYRFHQNDLSGFAGAHSMYGYSFRKCSVGEEILDLGLDLETLEFLSTYRINGRSSVVCDLDNLTYMQEAWGGFTTGEVKMELKAYMYRDAEIPFTFMITDLCGLDLSNDVFIDEVGPTIKLENELSTVYVNNLNKVPSVSIDDYSGVKREYTNVYYNYGSNTEYLLDSSDGYFKPTKEGIYTIEYIAIDGFNNTTIKKVKVNAVNGNPSDYDVSISTNFDSETYAAGTKVSLPYVSTTVNSEIYAFIVKDGAKYSYQSEFTFDSPGTYLLTFIVIDDYDNKKTFTKEYVITGGLKPIFEDEAVLPLAVVEGGLYNIDDYFAIDYNGENPELLNTVVSVDLGNGYKICPDRSFKCVADTNTITSINVMFIASNAYGTEVKEYTIPYANAIVDDSLHLENLFIGNNIKTEATDDYVEVSSVKSKKQTDFIFANALNAQGLSIGFTIDPIKCNFDAVVITLVDAEDPSLKVKLRIEKQLTSNCALFSFNDYETFTVDAGFKNDVMLLIEYEDATRKISTTNFSTVLRTDAYGNEFKGFTSGRCYMMVEFENVTGSAGIKINKINKQNFNNTDVDYIKPTVAVLGEYDSVYAHNEVVKIYKAYGTDVIDPSPSCLLTVKDFEGNVVTDINGLALENVDASIEYFVKLCSYGNYLVTYAAKDASKRSNSFMYVLAVNDNVAPVINVSNKTFNVSKNQGVYIGNVSATDDYSNVTLTKRLVYPTGQEIIIDDSVEGVSFTQSGTYYVVFIAKDEAGNMSSVSYKIIVK